MSETAVTGSTRSAAATDAASMGVAKWMTTGARSATPVVSVESNATAGNGRTTDGGMAVVGRRGDEGDDRDTQRGAGADRDEDTSGERAMGEGGEVQEPGHGDGQHGRQDLPQCPLLCGRPGSAGTQDAGAIRRLGHARWGVAAPPEVGREGNTARRARGKPGASGHRRVPGLARQAREHAERLESTEAHSRDESTQLQRGDRPQDGTQRQPRGRHQPIGSDVPGQDGAHHAALDRAELREVRVRSREPDAPGAGASLGAGGA